MASLSVDYERARTVGRNLVSKSEDFLRLLNQIQETNRVLAVNWLGEDAKSYTDAVNTLAEEQKKLQETIRQAGEFTISAGNTYQSVMEGNRDAVVRRG